MNQNDNHSFQSFLGSGWSFPPTFNKEARIVEMVSNEEDVDQSLRIILSTSLGERVMQSRFGCNVRDYLFEPLNASLKTYLRDLIETAILYFEPRVDVNSVLLDQLSDPIAGELTVDIDYTIRSTNTRYNLVYPFYLNEGDLSV